MNSDTCIVFVTTPSMDFAKELSRKLLDLRLCACANIIPSIHSIYHWQGQIEESAEFLVLLKTDQAHIAELENKVIALHSYSTPEFVVVKADNVNSKYQAWLQSELS